MGQYGAKARLGQKTGEQTIPRKLHCASFILQKLLLMVEIAFGAGPGKHPQVLCFILPLATHCGTEHAIAR